MAEAILAFGIATNIVQFIDFTSKVISASIQIGRWQYGGLSGTKLIETINNDLRNTLMDIERSVLSHTAQSINRVASQNELELLRLADQCKEVADQLFAALESLKTTGKNVQGKWTKSESHPCWQNFRAALKTVWRDEEIKELESKVDSFRQQLIMRILVSFREQMKDAKKTQGSIEKHVIDISQTTEGLGEYFLEFVEESRRWQSDLIDAIHRDKTIINDLDCSATLTGDSGRALRLQQKILEQLHFAEMTDRENRITEAHGKTFQWIYESRDTPWPSFTQWLETGSGLYWITGKAGSGKSTLMKYIYNDSRTMKRLQAWSGSSALVTAAFFFWNSGANLQMSQMGLLRSVLHQILLKTPTLIPRLLPKRWETYNLFSNDPHPWSLPELRQAFNLLAFENTADTRFCFFIDGLDEFDGDHSELNLLFKEVTCSENIKICVSSRPWVVFEDAFGGSFFLMLQDLTKKDIQIYVQSNFEGNPGFEELQEREPKYSRELQHHVANKADGVFLWVHLVVSSLLAGLQNGDRVIDLENRLNELPRNLEELYHKMLSSLDPFYYSHASQYFQLANAASIPPSILTLSYADEEPNFVFDCQVRPLSDDEKWSRANTMRKRLNSRCKGLLEISARAPRNRKLRNSVTSTTDGLDASGGMSQSSTSMAKLQNNVKDCSIAEATVQYLHRTVKDYVERPSIWDQLLERGPTHFDPNLELCRAYVAQLKQMDPNRLTWGSFWAAVRLCIEYANVDSDPTGGFIQLLDELDRAATELVNAPRHDGSTFVQLHSRFDGLSNGGLYPHWSCTFSGDDAKRGLSFLSLAVRLNLYYYVRVRASKTCLMMQNSGIWPLLRDAVTLHSNFNKFFGIRSFPDFQMVALLLNHGADPNWGPPSETVFKCLLAEAARAGASRKYAPLPAHMDKGMSRLMETKRLGIRAICRSSPDPAWIETIYEFLSHGADRTIDLEEQFGLRFLGAVRSNTQVVSNQGLMKLWFGIGNNVKVFKNSFI